MITLGVSDWPSVPKEPLCEPGLSTGYSSCYPVAAFLGPSPGRAGSLDGLEPHYPPQLTSGKSRTGLGKNLLLLGATPPGPHWLHRPTPSAHPQMAQESLGHFPAENPAPVLECQADSVGQRCQRPCSSRWDLCSDQLRLGDQDWPGFRVWESSHPWSGWGVLAQAGSDTRSQATRSGHKTGGPLLLSPCGVLSQEGNRVGAQLTLSLL